MATLPGPAGNTNHALAPLDIDWSGSVWPLVRCLTEFSLGVLAYSVFIGLSPGQASSLALLTDPMAVALLILLVLHKTDIVVVAAAAVLMLALAADQTRALTSRLLACTPIFFLGEISYSIYLLHIQEFRVLRLIEARLLHHLPPHIADSVALLGFFCVLFASACMTYYFIEKPGRRLIRGLEMYLLRRGVAQRVNLAAPTTGP
jgi:peptidoglycan/LPS O-acetylase OafA/YrhL